MPEGDAAAVREGVARERMRVWGLSVPKWLWLFVVGVVGESVGPWGLLVILSG